VAAPPFWLAVLLIVFTPFEGLITALLGGFNSSARQWFAMWKEVLLAVGIFRVLWHNPKRRMIFASNRLVIVCTGFMLFVYLVTLVRAPNIPAIFALDLETRFLGVMVFFMFLDLDQRHASMLLRAMIWSVSLIALYGLIQYQWDYDRLLPFMYHVADLTASGTRRLYSYSLSVFDAGYGAVIAILISFARVARMKLWTTVLCLALLLPCLMLTFVRSAYISLLVGAVAVCIIDRVYVRRYVLIGGITLYLLCITLLFAGSSLPTSDIGRRINSISSQNDGSSAAHKRSMAKAMQTVSSNPLGIGLGKSGIVEARFAGGVDESQMTEDWVLQVAVQTGVIGAFAYICLIVAILVSLLRTRLCRNKDARLLRVAAGAVFVAMNVAGVMIPVWDHLLTTVYAWALVGMGLAACRPRPPQSLKATRRDARRTGKQSQIGMTQEMRPI
jgi:hypothetical protein